MCVFVCVCMIVWVYVHACVCAKLAKEIVSFSPKIVHVPFIVTFSLKIEVFLLHFSKDSARAFYYHVFSKDRSLIITFCLKIVHVPFIATFSLKIARCL